MPWRTEPEIDEGRQRDLSERRSIEADVKAGIYPFGGVHLERADLEWLLSTHESGGIRGPVLWGEESHQAREALDLRGADLHRARLSFLPLSRTRFGLTGGEWFEVSIDGHEEEVMRRRDAAAANLREADLRWAHLEGAHLMEVHLDKAVLLGAHLECADLARACLTGASLIEAHLEGTNLGEAHMEGVSGRDAHLEGATLFNVHGEKADFTKAHLEGAVIMATHLEEATFDLAHLEGVYLSGVRLQGASLDATGFCGAYFSETHLEGASLRGARFDGMRLTSEEARRIQRWNPKVPEVLIPARLFGVFFDSGTGLAGARFGNRESGFAMLFNIRWGDVNLTMVNWDSVETLGGAHESIQYNPWNTIAQGDGKRLIVGYVYVVANRQLATAFRAQGLNDLADRVSYHAQVLQREVYKSNRKRFQWLFWWLLDQLAGYGYRPGNTIRCYVVVLLVSTAVYFWQALVFAPHVPWYQSLGVAVVASLTAVHGRGFFPEGTQGGWQLAMAGFDAVAGLLIEASFVATFVQRFFAR